MGVPEDFYTYSRDNFAHPIAIERECGGSLVSNRATTVRVSATLRHTNGRRRTANAKCTLCATRGIINRAWSSRLMGGSRW